MKPIINTSSQRSLVLGDEVEQKPSSEPAQKAQEALSECDIKLEIPSKTILNGVSTKDLNGFREIRKSVKLKLLEDQFISETKKILEYLDKSEKKYDSKIVLWVCNSAEMYFTSHKKMGDIKKRAVIQSVKSFYNEDPKLVESIIELVFPLIKKSNVARRAYNKVSRFVFLCLAMLVSKN